MLEELEAEYAIRRVLARYAHAIDREDSELLRTCYHPDAIDEHGTTYSGGIDGFIEHLKGNVNKNRMRFHDLGAPLIEISGDVATAETYCTSNHIVARDENGPERVWILWVRYEDRFEKRNGEWRIAHRICRFDGDVVVPASATQIRREKKES